MALRYKVEIYYLDKKTNQHYWKETSSHNNREYAEANYEVKSKHNIVRIKHSGKVLKQNKETENE